MVPFTILMDTQPTQPSSEAVPDTPRAENPLAPLSTKETACTNPDERAQTGEGGWGITSVELERRRLESALADMVSSISYTSIRPNGEEETHSATATRRQVQSILPNFHHLRMHLRAIVKILDIHSPETFSQFSMSSLDSNDENVANLATAPLHLEGEEEFEECSEPKTPTCCDTDEDPGMRCYRWEKWDDGRR